MKKTVLENGVTVITRSMPSPIAAASWRLEGGAAYERPDQHGAAHFLEHVLISDRRNITRPLEQLGVQVNACTTHEAIEMSAVSLPQHLPQSLGCLLHYGLVSPGFTTHDVAREKQAILMEIVEDRSEAHGRLFRARNDIMFEGMPYGRDVLGTENEVKSLNKEKLRGYLGGVAYSERLTVIAAGRVDHQQVVDMVAQHTASLPMGCPLAPAQPSISRAGAVHLRERAQEGDSSAVLMVSFNTQAVTPRLKAVFSVLGFALDQGLESILLDQLRHRRRLVYGAEFGAYLRPHGGHVDFLLTTAAPQLGAAAEALAETVTNLPHLLTRQAFARAHAQVMTTGLSEPDVPEIWIERAGHDLASFGRIRSRAEFRGNVTNVTRDDVIAAAEALRTQPPFIASLGPQRRLPLQKVFDDRLARHYRVP